MKDSSNNKCLKSLCVERKYEQLIHKLNRKNNIDTCDFNQSQLYKHVIIMNYTKCTELLNPHSNINMQTNTNKQTQQLKLIITLLHLPKK